MKLPSVTKKDLPTIEEKIIHKVDETSTKDMYENDYEIKSEENYNKYIEKIIRKSYEYRSFIKVLKQEMDLTKCKFIPDVDISDDKKLTLEMHHYPLSLYDLVSSYRETLKMNNAPEEAYQSFNIANNIMKMHFDGKVGLVPLSYTAHELAHSGELFIPLNSDFVFGNFEESFEELFLEAGLESKIEAVKRMTKNYEKDPSIYESEVLNKVRTEIEMKYAKKPEKIDL